MSRKSTWVTLVLIVVFLFFDELPAETYVYLYSDEAHSSMSANNTEEPTLIEVWVWIVPGANGVICAEYKMDLPDDLALQSVILNPANSVALGVGIGAPGLSICFPECITDWFWTEKIQILLTDREERYLAVSKHDDALELQVASCLNRYPVEPMVLMNYLYINTELPPILIGLDVTGTKTLTAIFDREVIEEDLYSIEVTTDNISIYERENPTQTIDVVSVEIVEDDGARLLIETGEVLDPQKAYILSATHLCSDGYCGMMCSHPVCGDSEIEFSGLVATENISWGAIKAINR